MMTRRTALKTTTLATLGVSTAMVSRAAPQATALGSGPIALPSLPYPPDALEPHLDAATMELHHGKHHAAYVNNANKALASHPELQKESPEAILKSLTRVPESIRTAIRNNLGGHVNHSLFWQMMKKGGGGQPKGDLARALDSSFGNYTAFQTRFTEAATRVFGSGWVWLVRESDGRLTVESSPNQDSPLMTRSEATVLLGLDVWEHAYYLKYQNRRPEYVSAWFNVINWDFVAARLAAK